MKNQMTPIPGHGHSLAAKILLMPIPNNTQAGCHRAGMHAHGISMQANASVQITRGGLILRLIRVQMPTTYRPGRLSLVLWGFTGLHRMWWWRLVVFMMRVLLHLGLELLLNFGRRLLANGTKLILLHFKLLFRKGLLRAGAVILLFVNSFVSNRQVSHARRAEEFPVGWARRLTGQDCRSSRTLYCIARK